MMNGSGGGSSAASQAISGSGPVIFGSETNPWLIAGIAAAVLGTMGLIVWLLTKK